MSRRTKAALENAKQAREAGQFFPIPITLLQSKELAALSPYANKLLLDLLSQWRLGNNGYLSATWVLMKARGWKSKATLAKALAELVAGDWIILTRQGGRNKTSLYAVSFYRIEDHHPNKPLEIDATHRPPGTWRKTKIKSPAPPVRAITGNPPSALGQCQSRLN